MLFFSFGSTFAPRRRYSLTIARKRPSSLRRATTSLSGFARNSPTFWIAGFSVVVMDYLITRVLRTVNLRLSPLTARGHDGVTEFWLRS